MPKDKYKEIELVLIDLDLEKFNGSELYQQIHRIFNFVVIRSGREEGKLYEEPVIDFRTIGSRLSSLFLVYNNIYSLQFEIFHILIGVDLMLIALFNCYMLLVCIVLRKGIVESNVQDIIKFTTHISMSNKLVRIYKFTFSWSHIKSQLLPVYTFRI